MLSKLSKVIKLSECDARRARVGIPMCRYNANLINPNPICARHATPYIT